MFREGMEDTRSWADGVHTMPAHGLAAAGLPLVRTAIWKPQSIHSLLLRFLQSFFKHASLQRRRGQQRMTWVAGIIDSVDMSLSKVREMVIDREAWRTALLGVSESQTRLSNWTTTATAMLRESSISDLHLTSLKMTALSTKATAVFCIESLSLYGHTEDT